MRDLNHGIDEEPQDADPDQFTNASGQSLPVIYTSQASDGSSVNLAIAAWLHAKFQRSRSAKTQTTYSTILQAFRSQLLEHGLDLDAADPRRVAADLGASSHMDEAVAELGDAVAERSRALALGAQAFAAQQAMTRYGARPVAPTTANLRLAAISSFYRYALRHDFLRGGNPIERVERQAVQAYAAARPLAYDELRIRLAEIDLSTPAGLRDYALLLLGLHTGRRVSELAGLRREHMIIRASRVEITWVRCKGGKTMRDELPRKGLQGLAAEALVAWVMRLYGEDGETEPLLTPEMLNIMRQHGGQADTSRADRSPSDGHTEQALLSASPPGALGPAVAGRVRRERPVWISLAMRNGTYGHPLSIRAIALINERRLGTSKVHTLRHTFARGLEDAGAKVSEIQARLGHADLGTTGRYLAQLHAGENPHLARLSHLYGLEDRLKRPTPPESAPDEQ
ncbi:MAG TPA: tyrosine-type recombinase/integrase [Ktedonobacterales bacterium]|jgi:site-specific recombinase XerD